MRRYSNVRRRYSTKSSKTRLYNNKKVVVKKVYRKRRCGVKLPKTFMRNGTLVTGMTEEKRMSNITTFVRTSEGIINVSTAGTYGGIYFRFNSAGVKDIKASFDFYRIKRVVVTFMPPSIYLNRQDTCMMKYCVDTSADPTATDLGLYNMQNLIRFNLLGGMPSTISFTPGVNVSINGTGGQYFAGRKKAPWISTQDGEINHKGISYFVEGCSTAFNVGVYTTYYIEAKGQVSLGSTIVPPTN